MKRTLLVTFAFLTPLLWAHPVQAADPDHVQQLLATNTCGGCDLAGADLRQAHLIGADLRNANLELNRGYPRLQRSKSGQDSGKS